MAPPTAVVTAHTLATQKTVLDRIDAVNRTNGSLIYRTSKMLTDNTLTIWEQATTSGISAETLQKDRQPVHHHGRDRRAPVS